MNHEGILTGWRLSAGDEHTVFDGANNRLAQVPCGGMSGRTFDEGAAAARLIAAAPDLLAALETALTTLQIEGVCGPECLSCALAREAIAKAVKP